MGLDLKGICVSVVGGDKRCLYLIAELVRLGAVVTAVGYPPSEEVAGAILADDWAGAGVTDALVLPLQGTDQEGKIASLAGRLRLTRPQAELIRPGTAVIIGQARQFLKDWAAELHWQLAEVSDLDQLAILNAIPTAEGAIQIAMEQLPITIHGSNSFVLGFGRVGKTLARMLDGIGACTTVVARKYRDRARIYEQGLRPLSFEQLPQAIAEAEIIFNTVPAPVLDRRLLEQIRPEALIVDLAASPGGTDFTAAGTLGVQAILAPGLPGKAAPKTSGRILAQVIPPLILQLVKQRDQSGGGARYGS
jgi:dipicolinate synthase subunit A